MRLVRYSYPSYRYLAPARSPWSGLDGEINALFETALGGFGDSATRRFPVELREDDANAYVRAELPGVSRDEIQLEVADDTLTIKAAAKVAAVKTEGEGEAGREAAPAWSFSRSVSVPDNVQTDKATATYENGVLTVTLPKREAVKPRRIEIA